MGFAPDTVPLDRHNDRVRWVTFINQSGVDIPPCSLVQISGFDAGVTALTGVVDGSQGYLYGVQCTVDSRSDVFVTGNSATLAGMPGQATRDWPMPVGYEQQGVPPSAGTILGVSVGAWHLTKSRTGFVSLGLAGDNFCIAVPMTAQYGSWVLISTNTPDSKGRVDGTEYVTDPWTPGEVACQSVLVKELNGALLSVGRYYWCVLSGNDNGKRVYYAVQSAPFWARITSKVAQSGPSPFTYSWVGVASQPLGGETPSVLFADAPQFLRGTQLSLPAFESSSKPDVPVDGSAIVLMWIDPSGEYAIFQYPGENELWGIIDAGLTGPTYYWHQKYRTSGNTFTDLVNGYSGTASNFSQAREWLGVKGVAVGTIVQLRRGSCTGDPYVWATQTQLGDGASLHEIQTIDINNATNGTFTVALTSADGSQQFSTTALAWNVSAGALQTALNVVAASFTVPYSVTVTGSGTLIAPFVVTFSGFSPYALITANYALLLTDQEFLFQAPIASSCGGSASWTVPRTTCVNGINIREIQTLTLTNGCITESSWAFESYQGCCGCTTSGSSPPCVTCVTVSGDGICNGTYCATVTGQNSWSAIIGTCPVSFSCVQNPTGGCPTTYTYSQVTVAFPGVTSDQCDCSWLTSPIVIPYSGSIDYCSAYKAENTCPGPNSALSIQFTVQSSPSGPSISLVVGNSGGTNSFANYAQALSVNWDGASPLLLRLYSVTSISGLYLCTKTSWPEFVTVYPGGTLLSGPSCTCTLTVNGINYTSTNSGICPTATFTGVDFTLCGCGTGSGTGSGSVTITFGACSGSGSTKPPACSLDGTPSTITPTFGGALAFLGTQSLTWDRISLYSNLYSAVVADPSCGSGVTFLITSVVSNGEANVTVFNNVTGAQYAFLYGAATCPPLVASLSGTFSGLGSCGSGAATATLMD